MAQSEIFRVTTFHKTQVFVDAELKLIHKAVGSNESPLYAKRTDGGGGVILFLIKDGETNYISGPADDFTVALSSQPTPANIIVNANGSLTFKHGKQFLSARKTGNFAFVSRNLGWEHFYLALANFVDIADENIFTLRTYHKKFLVVDENNQMRQRTREEKTASDRILYARRIKTGLEFFTVENNDIRYISAINNVGRFSFFDSPKPFRTVRNEGDNSLAIVCDGLYWSADKKSNRIGMTDHNRTWEHFFVDKVEQLDIPNANVVVAVLNPERLDVALARLNRNKTNLKLIVLDGADAKTVEAATAKHKVPCVSFNRLDRIWVDNLNSFWLLAGYKNSIGELDRLAERLSKLGLSNSKIINIEPKVKANPTWLANIKAAIDDCNFIAVGGIETAIGIDVNLIGNKKGINLGAAGQDIRQSYLTVKHVFEHAKENALKFVLIGLTPDEFNLGSDAQYIFLDGGATLDEKILHRMMTGTVEFPSEDVPPEPNFDKLRQSLEQSYSIETVPSDIDISDAALQWLESLIRLCLERGAKPIGVLMPLIDGTYPVEKIALFRRILKYLEQIYDFKLVEFNELKQNESFFLSPTLLNLSGTRFAGNLLNVRLHDAGVLSFDDMRAMTYSQLFYLNRILSRVEYNGVMNRIFDKTVERIRGKEKIKIGFVVHYAAMWCGDRLYNMFAQNERYETTLFVCLRMDGSALVKQDWRDACADFKSRGLNVFAVGNSDIEIPKQDVFMYCTPLFGQLPKQFRTDRITADSLLMYIPYTMDVHGVAFTEVMTMYLIAWRMFSITKMLHWAFEHNMGLDMSRIIFSGHPKLDDLADGERDKLQYDWKMAQPDAVKIIWSPHWTVQTNRGRSTFRYTHEFFYEYAKAHPETSWIVKPHPALLSSAVSLKVFPSVKAFKDYIQRWNDLPNARFVTSAYYRSIFATSDGMIQDCCSFVAEYQYTDKPMLYLMRPTTVLNVLGRKIVNANYHVDGKDFDAIKHFIEDVVINKNDPQAEARRKVFDEELNYVKDNGMLASDMIFKTVDDALSK